MVVAYNKITISWNIGGLGWFFFGKLNKTHQDDDFNWSQAFDAIHLQRLQGKMELYQNAC